MNVLRKLAWAAVLASSGVTPAEDGPLSTPAAPAPATTKPAAAPAPAKPAAAPARPARPVPASQPAAPGSTWPLDLDDDEFEGEGWSFWPLARPGR